MPYSPAAGDLLWTDFDHRTCRDQSGRRPELVISPVEFKRASEIVIVCQIKSSVRNFVTSVVLPQGLLISGEVLTGHVRSIDTLARPIIYIGQVPPTVLDDVRAKLVILIGA